ncbi:hypothetical protein [Dyadobacter psychrophilus]|uniref:Uncharacterized protein n=1 Tax=Dyadobacter psychrophilus TaxID=651661 RepID=A0A1T5H7Q3_9BACT|nr:hypothetical protein [Dyadobacter psychrophilus]SKC16712.1 hypothetical protein SAMN05660293_05030 [Dyadobacter psychrophilus]
MEENPRKGNIFKYIAYVLIAAAVIGFGIYFLTPKKLTAAEGKNMLLFIDNQIVDIDRNLKSDMSKQDIATRLSWHKSNTSLYNEVKGSKDKVIKPKAEILEKKIVQVQTKEFPELRTAYVESKKEVLGTQQITIALSGPKNDTLVFTGSIFASEKRKDAFLDNIKPIVQDLRFKKVVYKWSDKDSSEYKVRAKPDAEI